MVHGLRAGLGFTIISFVPSSVPVLGDVNNAVHCLHVGLGITILSFFQVQSPY